MDMNVGELADRAIAEKVCAVAKLEELDLCDGIWKAFCPEREGLVSVTQVYWNLGKADPSEATAEEVFRALYFADESQSRSWRMR